ncbi:hypothetical protein CAter282_1472 [Collimonas arenae]|uniref:Tat (Twin-arginine translocation) pathway signal sequence domain protein n=1 Tax=Collimonas arenae TaxID=279058 RepID=A0A127QGU0_9BURK|nr:DUF1501 domain-containing protein [Collimonas arenae]AMO99357.1 hypothetical protein CAter10_1591 [Collimonas arenae]AMP09261.1 hypothetical protein CAter282_1472 [Collimonas arenae]
MKRRDFIRHLGLGASGAILIPVGLSGCVVAPPVKQQAKVKAPAAPTIVSGADSPLSYGNPLQRPHASGDGTPRMIVVFLRGAVDGLNVVVPHGDHNYYKARPTIAVAKPGMQNGAIDLTGYFGLHPALQPLQPFWDDGRLAFVHASGSPDMSRSHFEAQDYMETGTPGEHNTRDGWMNRMLGVMPPSQSPMEALTLGEAVPRILTGKAVVANMPTGRDATRPTLIDKPEISQAYAALYAQDAALGKSYRDGIAARKELLADASSSEQKMANNGAPLPNGLSIDTARLGRLMRSNPDIRLGFVAVGGWDTHANQGNGTGQLAGRLRPLADGLATLVRELGPAFNDTVIVVMSEFGRTFRENGNGGTDHGHGNAMWLLGGNVRGRSIYGQWPGIDDKSLNENRDLAVTTDFRSVLATLAEKHMRIGDPAMQKLFPQYGAGNQRGLNLLV